MIILLSQYEILSVKRDFYFMKIKIKINLLFFRLYDMPISIVVCLWDLEVNLRINIQYGILPGGCINNFGDDLAGNFIRLIPIITSRCRPTKWQRS